MASSKAAEASTLNLLNAFVEATEAVSHALKTVAEDIESIIGTGTRIYDNISAREEKERLKQLYAYSTQLMVQQRMLAGEYVEHDQGIVQNREDLIGSPSAITLRAELPVQMNNTLYAWSLTVFSQQAAVLSGALHSGHSKRRNSVLRLLGEWNAAGAFAW